MGDLEQGGWDRLYGGRDLLFTAEPDDIIARLPDHLAAGRVIDLGAGEGRNSLFLAARGFEVTAIEGSAVAVSRIEALAKERGLTVRLGRGDIRRVPPGVRADAILAILVLHYLSRDEALAVVSSMKKHTSEGGVNALSVVTTDSDISRALERPGAYFFAEPGELAGLYADWEVLEKGTRRWRGIDRHPDGSHYVNGSEELLAKKPRS